jgi:hypothetical protein
VQDHAILTNEELLNLDVDILIPAALENQITVENADPFQPNTLSSKWPMVPLLQTLTRSWKPKTSTFSQTFW